jgi:hypothetical protein
VSDTGRQPRRRLSTRALLVTAAFAALGAVLLILVAPITSLLAALFPPAYALAAGLHSVLPFLARRLLGIPWITTIAFALVGVVSIGFTVLGALILIPLVLTGVAFDLTLFLLSRRARPRPWHYYVAAAVTGVALFLVSLPVMSPDDLAPAIVVLTLCGRLLGQLGAAALSAVIARGVERAGIIPQDLVARPGRVG